VADRTLVAHAIADAFLAGNWDIRSMTGRGVETIGRSPRWIRRAARRALQAFDAPPLDRRDELTRLLLDDDSFARQTRDPAIIGPIRRRLVYEPAMGPRRWDVPEIPTAGALRSWLGVDGGMLDWLADRKGLERFARTESLRNYRYRWVAKRLGGWRLIEIPKARLKGVQRRILNEILEHVPAHANAHGFRRNRSVVTFASPHAGQRMVLRMDLRDFFATISIAHVFGIFRSAGYPEEVARILSALCTNRVPRDFCRQVPLDSSGRRRLQTPHLPQGAPISPALANLCAYGIDVRLSALCLKAGGRYTRYADDLAFSFDALVSSDRFLARAAAIVCDEGFEVNFRKVRCLTQASRQQLAGVVVNDHPNVPRAEFDRLKAALHNCAAHGLAGQDREGSGRLRETLLGRISWVSMLNPKRGRKLRALYEQITWS